MTQPPIDVVGIGADGWDGLGAAARAAVDAADVIFGSARQLALLPAGRAQRRTWPSPLLPALPGLLEAAKAQRTCVLASGDPMFHGIGVTLARLVGAQRLRVYPQPSSASLACARLGWPLAQTTVVSLVNRPVETLVPALTEGARLLVLSADAGTPAAVVELLRTNGFAATGVTVLEQLGGPAERLRHGTAADWAHPAGDPLNVVALTCHADPDTRRLTRIPGLPDEIFGGTGQFTKQEVRVLTVAALAPAPGELLWDVGGGSGSIAIEWTRTHPDCRAIAFEKVPARAAGLSDNARRLGVPQVQVLGSAPAAFEHAPDPDAVFVGGGVTEPGLLDACWSRLRAGGRLVANSVTAESDAALVQWATDHGGALRRLQVYRGEALGGFTAWRPHLPVTQLTVHKPVSRGNGSLAEDSGYRDPERWGSER